MISLRAGARPELPKTLPDEPYKHPEVHDEPPGRREIVLGPEHTRDLMGVDPAEIASVHLTGLVSPMLSHIVAPQVNHTHCLVYEVDLGTPAYLVSISIGVNGGFAIALRAGKAVASKLLTPGTPEDNVHFDYLNADRVLVYVNHHAKSLMVCRSVRQDPSKEEADWAGAELIASEIQMPFRSVNPKLGSLPRERELAESRLLPRRDTGAR